ncbi:MAG: UDP-N-acetylmuramate--L-alanine ligase [Anaerolineales bacterium]|nr:UDP-N-acetylmuramate--L-alanine ligase [Anaerolineales bacterium]MCX7607851.1 UDP-N-acetylmuramate--L-alanine ligase [Anaerolineales bacterium]MDW8227861.1 UDP-N-acetylmuramate--L-alanine ligase [Anaerolineales bacterium]
MQRIHLIGIGGTGISAIARLLLEMGYQVSGSDRAESPFTRALAQAGATIFLGHRPENVLGADLVVRSSAVLDDNPEVLAAHIQGIPVLKRADFLGHLMEGKTGLAVAGTHGKTTTTAMLAWTLMQLGEDPTFIVGSTIHGLGVNAHAGGGRCFVIEADEYDRMFLGLKPVFAIVTSVEHDHPDCYPTPQDFYAAFVEFVHLLPPEGVLIACADEPGARRLSEEFRQGDRRSLTYSLTDCKADAWADRVIPNERGGFDFTAHLRQAAVLVSLQVPGLHNVSNALAALTALSLLGVDLNAAAQALGKFEGTGRRFEVRGEASGVTIIDDYAHHPTEIRTTLAAARARYPHRRIWAVWQPHTYSRTQTLLDDFRSAFPDADCVVVTEVYAAREPKQDFSARQIVEGMSHPAAYFGGNLEETRDFLLSRLQPGDVLLVLSAGDADWISAQTLAFLKEREK